MVNRYIKPAVLKTIDSNQFGTIPNSSTTFALIDMLHHWISMLDGTGATIRVILFYYKKAFEGVPKNFEHFQTSSFSAKLKNT